MPDSALSRWRLRIITLLLAALAGASAAFWILQWQAARPSRPPPPAAALLVGDTEAPQDTQALAGWLGATDALAPNAADAPTAPLPSAAASDFELLGVVAQARTGWALIARKGEPPKPFQVGSLVHENWRLQSVSGRTAVLVNAAEPTSSLNLELPPLPKAEGW